MQKPQKVACRLGRRALGFTISAAALAAVLDPVRAEDVNITTSTNAGVNLDTFAGTTARVFPGVTVNSPNVTVNSGTAVRATLQAWTFTNEGTLTAPQGNGVTFNLGGTVNNLGTITPGFQGVRLGAGGTVNNFANALIDSGSNGVFVTGGAGALVNAGTIRSAVEAVTFEGSGTVTNQATGLIEATNTFNAISIQAFAGNSTRSVINDGIIRNTNTNGGDFPAGISIAGGTVTNNATGTIFGTFNAIWGNGSATLTVNNAGLLESNDLGGSAIELDQGGAVTNSGRITNTGDGIVFFAPGSVTNRGTIESTNGGRSIVFTSGSNTLTLDTGSVLTGNVQGGSGTNALVLAGTGTETIAKFLSFHTLSMQGASWTLTGAGTFSTSSTVQSGILTVSGTLTSPVVTVQSNGTLSGTGTIAGNVVNAGKIAPGASIGTLHVTGDITFNARSTYDVEVNAAGAGDRTIAAGTVTIQGGTVNVLASAGNFAPFTSYTILTGNVARTGIFAGVTSNFAFLTPTIAYDSHNVILALTLNALDFTGVAVTRNQFATGRIAGGFGPGNPVWDALVLLDAQNARNALDLLSGEIHASLKTGLFEDSEYVRASLLARVRQAFADDDTAPATLLAAAALGDQPLAPGAPARRYGVWGEGFGAVARTDGDGNGATLTRAVRGFFAGADLPLGEQWFAGIAAGYGHTSLDADARSASALIDSFHIAGYGGARFGPIGLRAGLAYAWHDVDTRRTIAFSGFADSVKANYGARTLQLFGEGGYTFRFGAAALEPYASLAYVRVSTNAFSESGGAASLSGPASHKSLIFSTIGLRGATRFALGEGQTLTLRGGLGWRHAFGAVTPEADLAFASAPSMPFGAAGIPVARNSLALDTGATLALGSRWSIGFVYSGQFAATAQSHRFSARATLRF